MARLRRLSQLPDIALHLTARFFEAVPGSFLESAVGLTLPVSGRLDHREAGPGHERPDYAVSVMSVIEHMIGPER